MSSNDEIKELKERVDRIEEWIRSVIRRPQESSKAGEGPEPAEEEKFELVAFDVKKVRTEGGYSPTYAYKLQVRNLTARPLTFMGRVAFLDSEGFELDNYTIGGFKVPAEQLYTHTGQAKLLQARDSETSIADIKAMLETLG